MRINYLLLLSLLSVIVCEWYRVCLLSTFLLLRLCGCAAVLHVFVCSPPPTAPSHFGSLDVSVMSPSFSFFPMVGSTTDIALSLSSSKLASSQAQLESRSKAFCRDDQFLSRRLLLPTTSKSSMWSLIRHARKERSCQRLRFG